MLTAIQKLRLPNQNNEKWGNWHLKTSNWTLIYARNGGILYEIDLEQIHTSAALLDWLFQLHAKRWMSNEDMRDLIEAFREIFDPQANLCSYREQRKINAPQFLRQRYQETLA